MLTAEQTRRIAHNREMAIAKKAQLNATEASRKSNDWHGGLYTNTLRSSASGSAASTTMPTAEVQDTAQRIDIGGEGEEHQLADHHNYDRNTTVQQQHNALQDTSITTHNVHSVRLHVDRILAHKPYVYMVQEANVAEAEVPMINAKA